MEVKGTSPSNMVAFVRQRFGEVGYDTWLRSLSPEAAAIFDGKLLASSWYSAEHAFFEPARRMCELFYGGDIARGAWDLGRFSAENTLRGVYKVFVRIGSPGFMLERASKIFETFYRPGKVRLERQTDGEAVLQIFNVDERSGLWEHRMGGFIEAAMEIARIPGSSVRLTQSVADGGEYIEYAIRWG